MSAHAEVKRDPEDPSAVIVTGKFNTIFSEPYMERRFPSLSNLARYIRNEKAWGIIELIGGLVGTASSPAAISYLNGHPVLIAVAGVTQALVGIGFMLHGAERIVKSTVIEEGIDRSSILHPSFNSLIHKLRH